MQNLTFDMLNQAWNALCTQDIQSLLSRVPMLENPRGIVLSRVDETPFVLTVLFRGFDQAFSDPERGTPMMKRFLLDWMRQFGQAQIQRGDEGTMIFRITKPSPNPMPQPAVAEAASSRSGPLVHIAQVRRVNGH